MSQKELELKNYSTNKKDERLEELQANEQELLQQVSSFKVDKQRLESTINRLEAESMTTAATMKQVEANLEEEKAANVSVGFLFTSYVTLALIWAVAHTYLLIKNSVFTNCSHYQSLKYTNE